MKINRNINTGWFFFVSPDVECALLDCQTLDQLVWTTSWKRYLAIGRHWLIWRTRSSPNNCAGLTFPTQKVTSRSDVWVSSYTHLEWCTTKKHPVKQIIFTTRRYSLAAISPYQKKNRLHHLCKSIHIHAHTQEEWQIRFGGWTLFFYRVSFLS